MSPLVVTYSNMISVERNSSSTSPSSFSLEYIANKTLKQYLLEVLNKRLILNCHIKLDSARTSCDDAENVAFKYIFPFMLILSMIGNTLVLVVYRSKFLKNTSTIILLSLKASANLAGVCCLSTEMIKQYNYDMRKNSKFEQIYWYIRPYALFFVNYFGTLAVW